MKFARALVLAWTRVYTAGLTDELRRRRYAEIASDLWEFEHDPHRPHHAGAHLLLRLVLGLRHDLCWRVEQRVPYVAAQRAVVSQVPRHPVVVTSAFTCSLTVHLIAGAAVIWLLAFPFHQRPMVANLSAESVPVPPDAVLGSDNDQTASDASATARAESFLETLLNNRYPLSILNGRLAGQGADVLKSAIAQSRFVLLGENHGNAQTPEFFGAVCDAAAPMDFHTLAVEEGPVTAANLHAWARQDEGLAQLQGFEQRSPDSIHLYGRREEFAMLQRCARASRGDFQLWGLIEEGIFRTPPAGYTEARRREDVMKSLFAANYEKAAATATTPPKVLLKFGALHVYRGLNPVGGTGIGHHVATFAETQGARSLHIRLMPATGAADRPASRYLQPLLDNLLLPEWTLFDLRPLRKHPDTAAHPDLATLVFGYDIVVMVP